MRHGGPEAAAPATDLVSEIARARFGVEYVYPVQRFVIANILEGHPQIVILPTGAGKSLCFQLPGLLLPGPTLVLVPLLSLLSDQLRRLAGGAIPVVCLRGGMSPEEKQGLFEAMRARTARIVLATPEACLAEANLARLHGCGIAHLVVDEAHCITEWGESFRPAYLRVGELARALDVGMVSAFTATASREVVAKIRAALFGDVEVRVVEGGADRPGISYEVRPTLSRGRALAALARGAPRPLLVFCRTRSDTERAARIVAAADPARPARFYHAGLARDERRAVEEWFLPSRDGALCATCAYGLGVDKPDIRTVAHIDVPASVEAYLQESGRAGRDGAPARAILHVLPHQASFARRIEDPVARGRFERMLGYAAASGSCRREALLSLIGAAPVACSGCDVCEGSAVDEPDGGGRIVSFVRRHPRRFTTRETARILAAEGGPRAERAFDDCVAGWGELSDWDAGHVEEAVEALLSFGALREHRLGPWKGKLSVHEKHASREAR
ncbi:MAG TPA: RecQ family ATP-dependent DNA helicase [Spirochaetia bacterium]